MTDVLLLFLRIFAILTTISAIRLIWWVISDKLKL